MKKTTSNIWKKYDSIWALDFAKLLIRIAPFEFSRTDCVYYARDQKHCEPKLGNFTLQHYLHIAQMIFFAWKGKPLFKDDFIGVTSGTIIVDVYKNWYHLTQKKPSKSMLEDNWEMFQFAKFILQEFGSFRKRELIELAHADPAWMGQENQIWYLKEKNVLNMKIHIECYKDLFKEHLKRLKENYCE